MKQHKTKLTFTGGVGSPTGSNFLLEIGNRKILVDCGFLQGEENAHKENYKPFPYDPSTVDTLLVTHAHLDHVGKIPKLVKDGFSGVIYSTLETKRLATLLFEDSLAIMHFESRRKGPDPLYRPSDVSKALSLWKDVPYYQDTDLGDGIKFSLMDAGHILGSAIVIVERNGRKIAFSGDLGNSPAPLLKDTDMVEDVSYLLVESVYGDRNHESIEDREAVLEDIIERTIDKKGVLMIPAFSIERTQVLLYEINNLVEKKRIPALPVFLDSPLAIRVTDLYKNSTPHFNDKTKHIISNGDDIFKFPNLKMTRSANESKEIAGAPNPKIIIAGSGMSEGGRITHHEKRYLPDPNNTLLLVGFQAAGSVGRKLQDGATSVSIHGDDIPVRARIESLFGYSAHRGSDGLLEFVEAASHKVEKVFVVLGELTSSTFLAQRIRDYLGVNAIVPHPGETVELDL